MSAPRFLVVDDDPDILFLVEVNIRAWGYECLTADTAEAAVEICGRERPQALLLDVMMPETDGPTLLQQLREAGVAPPHVVLMSALPPDELGRLAQSLGAAHVSKPFSAAALREAFRPVLEGA